MDNTFRSHSYVVLGVKEKLGYGFGDLASNLSFGMVSLFLLFFYTNIYGISAGEASLIFFIARIIDAIFNLILGYFVDKTHTRYGKLRPYLLYGAVPLGILTVMCFVALDIELKFYYALISYTLYCLAYTAINTPYSALTNMMTQHEGSRASLSVYRLVMATIGYLIVSTSAEKIISQFTEPKLGIIFAVSLFALLATFLFLACFGMTKERIEYNGEIAPPKVKAMCQAVLTNAPLMYLSSFTIFFYIAYTVWMAIAIYFIKYIIQDDNFVAPFFAIQTAASMFGTIVSEKLIAIWGKKSVTLFALLLGAAGLILQYFFAGNNIYLIMTCVVIFSITLYMGFVTMWSMIADTVEYGEWKNGARTEGAVYGFFNFVTKVAMAIGGGLSGLILSLAHYSDADVSETALWSIEFMMTLLPAGLFILGFICLLFYCLDEKTYRRIVQEIAARKPSN